MLPGGIQYVANIRPPNLNKTFINQWIVSVVHIGVGKRHHSVEGTDPVIKACWPERIAYFLRKPVPHAKPPYTQVHLNLEPGHSYPIIPTIHYYISLEGCKSFLNCWSKVPVHSHLFEHARQCSFSFDYCTATSSESQTTKTCLDNSMSDL